MLQNVSKDLSEYFPYQIASGPSARLQNIMGETGGICGTERNRTLTRGRSEGVKRGEMD